MQLAFDQIDVKLSARKSADDMRFVRTSLDTILNDVNLFSVSPVGIFDVARIGPDEGEAALREPHVRVFDITGKSMKKWVAVEPEGVEDDGQLNGWIERATKFVRTLPRK